MIRETFNDRMFVFGNYLFIGVLLVMVFYPLVYIVSASISDPVAVNSGRMWLLPQGLTLEGFERVFRNPDILLGYRNTLFYTFAGTFINLCVTLPCAYALSRTDLPGRTVFLFIIIFTMFFSGGLIPTYLLVRDLGLINTPWALLLPKAATAWNILVAMAFFRMTIPRELQDAADIDGCSTFRFFMRIVLPLSKPIIAVMALFYAVGHWNQYFDALIYLSDRNLYPLQLFLREILVQQQMSASMMMDGAAMEALAEQARIADIVKYAVMIVASLPLL
ncbi:MAG: carbohydrate ABC transporter permease, partial [Deinococcota bacterium]|nr:carbohydrate ABC transporter permease [Deinococcota bacterium]